VELPGNPKGPFVARRGAFTLLYPTFTLARLFAATVIGTQPFFTCSRCLPVALACDSASNYKFFHTLGRRGGRNDNAPG